MAALPDWVKEHIEMYLRTDGEEGHIWRGVTTLLLTTIGKQSGAPRLLPLIYGEFDAGHIIIASKGGHPEHPSWYTNLVAEPRVKLQVKGDKFAARAETITDARRDTLWQIMVDILPPYTEYQAKTDRQIPVVLLTRD